MFLVAELSSLTFVASLCLRRDGCWVVVLAASNLCLRVPFRPLRLVVVLLIRGFGVRVATSGAFDVMVFVPGGVSWASSGTVLNLFLRVCLDPFLFVCDCVAMVVSVGAGASSPLGGRGLWCDVRLEQLVVVASPVVL